MSKESRVYISSEDLAEWVSTAKPYSERIKEDPSVADAPKQ
jgi:hypothetical protein